MKLAFCLIHYFPFGGMQRDFTRIAKACLERGHTIDVYVSKWEGEHIKGVNLITLPSRRMTNHHRVYDFSKKLSKALAAKAYNLIIGFNKLPNLDYYFAADGCFLTHMQTKSPFLRLTPRYYIYKQFEKMVFSRNSSTTHIFALSQMEMNNYKKYYNTQEERFILLPPEVNCETILKVNSDDARQDICNIHNIDTRKTILLMIASRFKTKGLDRALSALSALSDAQRQCAHLIVIGSDAPKPYKNTIQQHGLEHQVTFTGGINNVADYLHAADIFIHPAYRENTGLVLLEALVAGLPVLTTDACGYAAYIEESNAGIVLPSPFNTHEMQEALTKLMDKPYRNACAVSAIEYRDKITDLKMIPIILENIEGERKK